MAEKKTGISDWGYKADDCSLCGKCLEACPYIGMDNASAKREMRRMRRGEPSAVLEKCAGCATCDMRCPTSCRPYALIRARWYERYLRKGVPDSASFMMPLGHPNFRSAVKLEKHEQRYVETLGRAPAGKTVLYAGCNALLLPEQLQSPMFNDLTVFGALEYCCGEMYYRAGLFDQAEQAARRLQSLLSKTKIDRMVFVCSACYNMISNVYPREFGVNFNFDKEFVTAYLLKKFESGELKTVKPYLKKTVVHDPCHAKLIGPRIHDGARALLEAAGATVVEPEHTRDESLCCGVAAGCPRYSPFDIFSATAKRLAEFDRSGADVAATYCNGCMLSLMSVRNITPSRAPLSPLLEIINSATGSPLDPRTKHKRSRQLLSSIILKAVPSMLNPFKRSRLPDIGPLPPL